MIATNKGRKTLLYLFPIVALLMAVGMSANGVAASSEFRVARAGDSQLTTHNSQLTTRNSSRPTTNIYCVKADGSATGAPCTNPNAIANIQTAIAGAAAGDEIRVAYGPFTGSGTTVINATVPLTIIGGFPGGTTGWTNSTDAINTVIDGQGIRLGVSVSGVNLVLQNLTVSNGGISNSGGTVSVQSGYTLNIQSGPTISGAFNIANGGVVAFTSGINTLASGTTFTGAGVARVTNGTLSVNGAVTAQNFDLVVGGTLTGSGTFTVNGVMNWTGGVMDSPSSPVGVTTIANGAVLNLGGISAAKVLLQRTLNNNGTTYMNGSGSGVLDLGNSTTFNNNGIFIIQNNDSLYYYTGATPHFNNAGTFRKSAGSGVSTFTNGFVELSNSGLIRTESGTLSLDGASGVNAPGDTGTFSATVGSTLRFGGNNHVMAPASTVDIAGTIEFSAGTTYINGSFNVSGNTLMSGGTVVFGAPAIIDTLNVTPNSTFSLTGSGSVLTVNHLNWTGGIIDGGPNPNNRGTINVPAGGTITLGGVTSNKILLRCTINNNGSALVNTTGLGTFYMGDAAVFNNNNLFNLANNDSIRYLNGVQSTFNNAAGATFRKSQGPLVSTLGDGFLQFNNSGAVEVQVGTLSLDYSATTPPSVDTGSYSVSNGATLRFNGVTSSRTLQAGSSITGAGTVEFSAGTVSIAGNYNVSGNTNVTGGTVQFNTPATTNAALLSAPGTLSGDSTFTTNAIFNWTGGTMSGQGTTIISPSSTLHIAGVNATKVLTQRTINNLGTVHVDGTGVGITYIGNGGVFNNGTTPNSDVNFFIENNDSIRYLSGTNCTFNNNGHLKKSLGAGISTLSDANLAFNNYGDVQVLTGTLSLDGGNSNGLNSTGPFTVTAQANLRFNGGAHTLVASSSIVGAGSVEFSAGTVNIGGNYNIGGTTSVTGGTVQFNANATSANTLVSAPGTLAGDAPAVFTTTNTFNWTGGTMSGSGITSIAPGATFNIAGVNGIKILSGRTVNNYGSAYVNGTGTGLFYLGSGAVFNNGVLPARFEIRNNDSILYLGGGNCTFNNNGLLERTIGAGTSILGNGNLSFNNSGTVNIYTGTISLESAGSIPSVDSGAYNVSSVAVLRFNGNTGIRNLQAGSIISATGSVDFAAGTVNIAGGYNVAGTGSTNIEGAGTVSFMSNGTSVGTNLSPGGTLSGSGIFTTTGTFNWTGGTMDSPSTTVGSTNIAPGATLNIGGITSNKLLLQRTLNNNGTALMNGTGVGNLYLGNGAHLNNNTSFNIQNNDNILYSSGADAVFTNNGTFGKTAGTGTSIVANGNLRFNNNGTVDVLTGVLNFGQNYLQTVGSTLRLNGGDVSTNGTLNIQGGTLVGTGAITGTVSNTGGTVSPSSLAGPPAATLVFNGAYSQGSGGAINVDIGGLTPGIDFDKITFLNNPTLTGTLNISLTNGFVPSVGSTFQVIFYPSVTNLGGRFTTINGTNIGGGRFFIPSYNTGNFSLTTSGNPATSTVTPTPCSSCTPTVTPTPGGCGQFSDVFTTDYFYEAVTYLACHNVISGYGTYFLPYNLTTRGQLSKIVVLAEGWSLINPPNPTFVDVPTNQTFYQYIETAYSHNIISGYNCGSGCLEFRPNANVTRSQLCKIVVNAEGWSLINPPVGTFRDVPTTDPFYSFIETAVSHSIISGYGCGVGCLEFRPSNNATRGQICKIVYLAITGPRR